MTRVEIQVQNGKVTITVGGESTTYGAAEAMINNLNAVLAQAQLGDAPAAPAGKQPVPARPAESYSGMFVLGPLVIDDCASGDASGGNPTLEDPRTGSGGAQGRGTLVLGPIVVRGGRVRQVGPGNK